MAKVSITITYSLEREKYSKTRLAVVLHFRWQFRNDESYIYVCTGDEMILTGTTVGYGISLVLSRSLIPAVELIISHVVYLPHRAFFSCPLISGSNVAEIFVGAWWHVTCWACIAWLDYLVTISDNRFATLPTVSDSGDPACELQ